MTSWIMFIVGLAFMTQGVLILTGRPAGQYFLSPLRAGWGAIAMGVGFAVDGLPRIVGWSDTVNAVFAEVGFALVLLGGILILRDSLAMRRHRRSTDA